MMPRKKKLTKKQKEELALKAERLRYSRPIYARREGNHPEAKKALGFLLDQMKSQVKITSRYERKYKNAMRIFVLDLLVAYQSDPDLYLTYSRDGNQYSKGRRYGNMYLGLKPTIKVVEFLIGNGYVEHHPGKKKEPGRQPRIKAEKKLIDLLVEDFKVEVGMFIWDWDEDMSTVILRKKVERKPRKDGKKRKPKQVDVDYEDTPETLRMKKNLRVLNRNLEKVAIVLDIPDEKYRDLFERMQRGKRKPVADFTRKWIRRIFNNESWEQGGRFYGGWWQNIPREYRRHIRLNYHDVSECDYSGLHINMLYAKEGLPMPEGDVYHVPGYYNDSVFRAFVKQLLLIMVNAKDKASAGKAINQEVNFEGLKLPSEIESTKAKDLDPLIDAFSEKHKPVAGYFCSGAGIDLQYQDSQIAEKVMLHFTKRGDAVLPMHDSFIVHHAFEQELQDIMDTEFQRMFDTKIKVDLKFNSIKERRKRGEETEGECTATLPELLEGYEVYNRITGQFSKYIQKQQQ